LFNQKNAIIIDARCCKRTFSQLVHRLNLFKTPIF